jgi:hypothetical protein
MGGVDSCALAGVSTQISPDGLSLVGDRAQAVLKRAGKGEVSGLECRLQRVARMDKSTLLPEDYPALPSDLKRRILESQ